MLGHHATPPPTPVVPPAVTEFLGVDPRAIRVRAELEALRARLAAEARLRPVLTTLEIPSPGLIPVPALARTLIRQSEEQRRILLQRELEILQRLRQAAARTQLRTAASFRRGVLVPVPGVARALAEAEAAASRRLPH